MKKPGLNQGKKLSKKELKVITGGGMRCVDSKTGKCTDYFRSCIEPQCRFQPGL